MIGEPHYRKTAPGVWLMSFQHDDHEHAMRAIEGPDAHETGRQALERVYAVTLRFLQSGRMTCVDGDTFIDGRLYDADAGRL